MGNLGLLLLACCCCLFASTQGEEYFWRVTVWTYYDRLKKVQESAEVNATSLQILMKADDTRLRKTPFYRSTSLHDFNQSTVALKPLGAKTCFVGPVKSDFDTTVKELMYRRWSYARRARRQVKLEAWPSNVNTTGSPALDDFCEGRQLVFFEDYDRYRSGRLEEPWIRWPPLDCIWGPVDIYYELGDDAESKLQDIFNFDGLFGPFP